MWHGLYILLAAVLWSTIGIASTIGGDVVMMTFARSVIAGSIALTIHRRISRASVLAGISAGVLLASYPAAAVLAGIGVAAYLLYTAPLWATLTSVLYGEKPRGEDILAVVLILVAVALMGVETGRGAVNLTGFAAGIASGASYGLYIAIARYYSRIGNSLDVSIGAMPYTVLVTAPLLIAYVVTSNTTPDPLRPTLAGLYLAVFCTLVPYRLFSKGVEAVGASKASVIASIEPVLAAVWGAIFFGQVPTALTLLAYALITLALMSSLWRPRK